MNSGPMYKKYFRIFHRNLSLLILCLLVLIMLWAIYTFSGSSDYKINHKITRIDNELTPPYQAKYEQNYSTKKPTDYANVNCLINEEYSISCLKKNQDSTVYIPFSFLRSYFEVSGHMVTKENGQEYFKWQHISLRINPPSGSYNHNGVFLWFQNYNVELRERVKYICGLTGVPISTQWNSHGHYYPIQIAQFALSHYSKLLTQPPPKVTLLITAGQLNLSNVGVSNQLSSNYVIEPYTDNFIIDEKITLISGDKVVLVLKKVTPSLTLNLTYKPVKGNFSMKVILQSNDGTFYYVFYTTTTGDKSRPNYFKYTIPSSHSWHRLTRDVGIDALKALTLVNKKFTKKLKNVYIYKIIFMGDVLIDKLAITSSAHEEYFADAVQWLLLNQNSSTGGWPVTVKRRLSNGSVVLQPGWYSAMAQGQAMSALTRMYHMSGNRTYLDAAKKATKVFRKNVKDGGVKTFFLNKFVWYEEYPTQPSIYVLNGFIYSLFGLYDLWKTCDSEDCRTTGQLLKNGVVALRNLLPLYDTGSGSLYDLRHFSLPVSPNLARADYHATHINQLLYLNTTELESLAHDDNIETERTTQRIFGLYAQRWIAYTKGHRASHN